MFRHKNWFLLRQKLGAAAHRAQATLVSWLPKLTIAALLWLLFSKERFSVQIQLGTPAAAVTAGAMAALPPPKPLQASSATLPAQAASILPLPSAAPASVGVSARKQKCLDYVALFLPIAREEAQLYQIPVAITLAQALLESNAGESPLAARENNHFGIKCPPRCSDCRCATYADDTPNDKFQVYDSPWFSFRAHSKLLHTPRYRHLLQLPADDYKNWAYGLQAAGYATDKKYAEKLIAIIEEFQLHRY